MGEFYIANGYGEQQNAILEWYDSENCNNLIIIDQYNRIDDYKEMRGYLDCAVTWLGPESAAEEGKKIIFINETFDHVAQEFVKNNWAIVGFFNH